MENHLRSEAGDPLMRWRLLQRGLWVHGVSTLFEYFTELAHYELSSVAADISCPALITAAENDPIAIGAPKLHAAIGAQRKTLISFTAAEGAGGALQPSSRVGASSTNAASTGSTKRCRSWPDCRSVDVMPSGIRRHFCLTSAAPARAPDVPEFARLAPSFIRQAASGHRACAGEGSRAEDV